MQKVNLDLVPEGVNPIVYASQNDDGRTIRFELVVSSIGGSWTLNGNETITAKITKPNGTAITIPITNPGSGKHYVDLVNGSSDYDQDGVYLGEVSITEGEKVLGTGNFVLKAEADPYDGKVQKKIVIDNPATFSTSLPDVLVSCKCKIDDANGIDSMDVINAGPTYARNSVPYQLRQTPITANRTLEKLIGVSCAFNQLFNFSGSTATIDGVTFTVNADNSITLSGTASDNIAFSIDTNKPIINGHKYLIQGGYDAHIRLTNTVTSALNLLSGISIKACNYSSNYTNFNLIVDNGTVINTPITVYPMLIDLTAMFGSEVADYLYNLEQNTAGSGIALFRQLFPEDYYAYQTATLISSKPVSKAVVGINQWDEVWEVSGSSVVSKNPIKVFPNTTYYMCCPVTADIDIVTSTGSYVAYLTSKSNATFTTPSNCEYIKFTMRSAYGTTYNHDISINLPSTDHDYHAYEEHTYPLGGDELRGLLKVENGQLVAYGDVYDASGNINRKFGIVDLGSLYWYVEGHAFYTLELASVIRKGSPSGYGNFILCSEFIGQETSTSASLNNMCMFVDSNGFFTARDDTYSTSSDFKTAMSGVYLIYELATPTTSSGTPFTNPMLCGSTEEFTDSRSLKMFCGHDSVYADNISFAHITFGQMVTDGTLDVVHGILTPTGGSPISVTPALIQAFPGVNNVFSNGGGDITVFYLDVL